MIESIHDGSETRVCWRSEAAAALALLVTLTGLYVWTMPPTVTLEDSGEFISVAYYAGIAHPPGYPLYTLLAHLFTWLPFGTVAERVHGLSALAGAGACVWLYLCARMLGARRSAAACAALSLGLSATFWSQAIIAEVYSLHAFLFFLLFALCLRLDAEWSTGGARLTAFILGLALSNHWPLVVLAGPSLLAALARPGRIRERARALWNDRWILLSMWALGLSPYLYLFVRSWFDPEMAAFGPLRSLPLLLAYVARARYRAQEASPTAGFDDSVQFVWLFLSRLAHEFSVLGGPLIAVGVTASFRFLRIHHALALLLAALSSSLLPFAFASLDYDTTRRDQYLVLQLAPFGAAALYLGCAFFWFRSLAERWHRGSALVLLVVVACACTWTNFARNDRRQERFAADYARALLESLPYGVVLFTHDDIDIGPVTYLHHVEGVRPDLRLYSEYGHMFRNRLFAPRDITEAERMRRLERFVAEQRRVFAVRGDTFRPARSLSVRSHGLFAEVTVAGGGDPWRADREILRASLVSRARCFLDAAAHQLDEAPQRIAWWTYWDGVMGDFCHLLLLNDVDHPMLDRGFRCKWQRARRSAAQGHYDAAARTLRELFTEARDYPKPGRQILYAEYAEARLAALRTQKHPSQVATELVQGLADEVRPAVDFYPLCTNRVLACLLELRSEYNVDIGLRELRARFGRCRNLRPLFIKIGTPAPK